MLYPVLRINGPTCILFTLTPTTLLSSAWTLTAPYNLNAYGTWVEGPSQIRRWSESGLVLVEIDALHPECLWIWPYHHLLARKSGKEEVYNTGHICFRAEMKMNMRFQQDIIQRSK